MTQTERSAGSVVSLEPISAGLIAEGEQGLYWMTILVNSSVFDLKAIWCFDESLFRAVSEIQKVGSRRFRIHYGGVEIKEFLISSFSNATAVGSANCSTCTANNKKSKPKKQFLTNTKLSVHNSFDRFIESPDISSFFIALPQELHSEVALRILMTEGKHIFSTNYPTEDKSRMLHLIVTYIDKRGKYAENIKFRPVWSILECSRHEAAFSTAKALLVDIGKVMGAQLVATVVPSMLQNSNKVFISEMSGKSSFLLSACISYSALLRYLFGNIKVVNCTTEKIGCPVSAPEMISESLSGYLVFESGVIISVMLTLSYSNCNNKLQYLNKSFQRRFTLSIVGLKGNIQLAWNIKDNTYEVRRFLQHYEHPMQFEPTSYYSSIQSWIYAVNNVESDLIDPTETLVDLTMATAMIESNGLDIFIRG